MKKCLICGQEYTNGVYHSIHCGVVYKDDRKCYDWNCNCTNLKLHEIKERIISSYVSHKANSQLIYE